jgi:hypothetical protein
MNRVFGAAPHFHRISPVGLVADSGLNLQDQSPIDASSVPDEALMLARGFADDSMLHKHLRHQILCAHV